MISIAWIGLGLIGLPMATRLASAGWRVRGLDINPDRMAMAAARGIAPARELADLMADAKLVFTSLPNEDALVEVVCKGDGLADRMPGDAILVETSTVGPQASAKVADALLRRRIAYLRAPISGSTALAETGGLTAFVSGPQVAFDTAREALKAYSRVQIWLGEREEARYAKLAVNLMVGVTAGMMGEALALARKGGIGWDAILDLIAESVVASPLVKYKLEPLRRRDFAPAATSALVLKDLDLVVKAAAQAGVPVPLAARMQGMYRDMIAAGLAEEDFFSVVRMTERQSGLSEPEKRR